MSYEDFVLKNCKFYASHFMCSSTWIISSVWNLLTITKLTALEFEVCTRWILSFQDLLKKVILCVNLSNATHIALILINLMDRFMKKKTSLVHHKQTMKILISHVYCDINIQLPCPGEDNFLHTYSLNIHETVSFLPRNVGYFF